MRLLVDLASCDNPDSGIGRRALALWPRVAGRLSARGGAVLLPRADIRIQTLAAGLAIRALTAAYTRQRVGDALLMPLSVLLMTWIAVQSVWWRWRGQGQWKGRAVPT